VGDVISAIAGKRMKRLQRAKVEAFILAQPRGAPIAFSMKRSAIPQVVRAPEPADATCYARAPSHRSTGSSSSSSSKHNQHVRAAELHAFVCIPATFGSAIPAYPGAIHDILVLPDLQLCDANSLLEHWNKRWRHRAESDSVASQQQQQQRMLVALRGGCSFEQKAASAQLIGANSLLVIDTQVRLACNHNVPLCLQLSRNCLTDRTMRC
jgi:hypothetical protein